jgi:hypothetical protein
VSKKEAKKMSKYRGLKLEIHHTRIEVITETNVNILKLFRKYHSKIPGKHITGL